MTIFGDVGPGERWTPGPGVAAEVLRRHRVLLSLYMSPPSEADETSVDADVAPSDATIAFGAAGLTRSDLPAAMLDLVMRYEASSPGARLVPLRLAGFGYESAGAPRGDAILPEDADLVSLTVTETVVSQQLIEVSSLVLLAARSLDDAG